MWGKIKTLSLCRMFAIIFVGPTTVDRRGNHTRSHNHDDANKIVVNPKPADQLDAPIKHKHHSLVFSEFDTKKL